MDCFANLIKYNACLVYLDLETTGLEEPFLKFIASLLNKAHQLRIVHLSGNNGLTDETIEWIRARIKGKFTQPDLLPPPTMKI